MRSLLLSILQLRGVLSAFTLAAILLLFILHSAQASPDVTTPEHVLTWASDDGGGGQTDGTTNTTTNPTSRRHIQTWVSFAELGITRNHVPGKAFLDCGSHGARCKLVVYYDPVKLYVNCWPDKDFASQNASEDFYLHDSAPATSSNRTTKPNSKFCNNSPVYYPNLTNPAVGQWFAQNLLWTIPQNDNTMMFQDDSNAECVGRFHDRETYTPAELQSGTSCEEALVGAFRTVANQMRWRNGASVPVVANGFAVQIPGRTAAIANAALVAPGSNIIGGVSEDAIIVGTGYAPRGVFGDVNTASLMYARNPDAIFGLLGRSRSAVGSTQPCSDAGGNREEDCGALQQRRNLVAAFWLAYKEGHTFLWERFNFDDKHILAVYPEASIYPSEPVQALKPLDPNAATTNGSGCGPRPGVGGIQSFVVACGTLNDGAAPAGLYVREFRRCYNFGKPIGASQCAVIMNTTARAATMAASWFTQAYDHMMTFGSGPTDGADVLTAGCGDAQCPKNVINPLGATFAVGQTRVPAFDAVFVFHS